jgi:hypothetical protein
MPSPRAATIIYDVAGRSQPDAAACWYTSLQIVVDYFRSGGMPPPAIPLTDPSEDPETQRIFRGQSGIAWTDNERIAHKLGFDTLAMCLTPEGMADLLVEHGPIIYSGRWPRSSSGHWVVVRGVSGSTLYVTDPWYGEQVWDYNTFFASHLVEHELKPLIHAP